MKELYHLKDSGQQTDSNSQRRRVRSVWQGLAFLLFLYYLYISFAQRFACYRCAPQHQIDSKLGAVATESRVCSQIGIDILKQGGNAADAVSTKPSQLMSSASNLDLQAIASTVCVGTVAMYHSGIGGGGFAVVRSDNGTYETIDFREAAPLSASKDMYDHRRDRSIFGALAR